METEPTIEEDAVMQLISDLEDERLCVQSLLSQLAEHDGAGPNTRRRAAFLLAAIEAAWPKGAVDYLRDDLQDEIAERTREQVGR